MKKSCVLSTLLAVALALAACGSESEAGVTIDGAWARTSPAMATTGAAYMDITAAEDDELVAASVGSSIAGRTEVHETVMADNAMSDESMDDESMTDDSVADESMDDESMEGGQSMEGMGEMMMQEVSGISLPAGETISLEPGGYHIMMFDLVEPLETGATFDVTLTFANVGQQVVTVEVRDDAP